MSPQATSALLDGHEDEYATQEDIVYQNEFITAKIAPKWWVNNPGHVLVVPNKHYENIYDIPEEIFAEVYKGVKKVALAIRSTYGCDGTSTRQHNEPAGNQDVWHRMSMSSLGMWTIDSIRTTIISAL